MWSSSGSGALVSVKRTHSSNPAVKNQDIVRRFTWEIASINVHLEELRYFWAKTLGISGPQWMILMALSDMDRGDGVPVNVVSKRLRRLVVRDDAIEALGKEGIPAAEDLDRGRQNRTDVLDRQD